MNANSWDRLQVYLQAAHLHPDEKSAVRLSLADQMGLPSALPRRSSAWTWQPAWAAAALFVALLAVGGIATAAETTLPGDALYGWKVGVNEEVRAALNVTTAGQADWAIRRLERRAEEVEQLIVTNQLTADNQATLMNNLSGYNQKSQALIAYLAKRGHEETAARLSSNAEATLSAHHDILVSLDGAAGEDSFATTLKTAASAASASRQEHEASVTAQAQPSVQSAATNRLRAAENKIHEVEKFIAHFKASHTGAVTAEAETKLATAKGILIEGQAKLSAGAYADAFRLFQKAHRAAQEAKLVVHIKPTTTPNLNTNAATNTSVNIQTGDPQPDHGSDSGKRPEDTPVTVNVSTSGHSDLHP